jgi:hypothetical protein
MSNKAFKEVMPETFAIQAGLIEQGEFRVDHLFRRYDLDITTSEARNLLEEIWQ